MLKRETDKRLVDGMLAKLEAGFEEYDDWNYTNRLYGIITGIEAYGAEGYIALLKRRRTMRRMRMKSG